MINILNKRNTILRPVISEKSYGMIDGSVYTFIIHPDSNKTQVKIAIEKIFDVKVRSVNILNRKGKKKRTKSGFGKRKNTKRAVVSLTNNSKAIEVFGDSVVS